VPERTHCRIENGSPSSASAAHAVLLASPDMLEKALQSAAAQWASRRRAERTVFREGMIESAYSSADGRRLGDYLQKDGYATARELDAAIVCDADGRSDGELLFTEPYAWYALPDWKQSAGEPLRLAALAAPCAVRAMALKTLDDAGVAWTEVFVGGGLPAVVAAACAGLAVAPLPRRVCPSSIVDVGERLGLPRMPLTRIVLHQRSTDPRTREAVRILAAALKASVTATS